MRDKDNWIEANKNRKSWGTKNYSPDMDFSQCMQSEPTDKYGTPHEIANACAFFKAGFDIASDSIALLVKIQKGISDEKMQLFDVKKLKEEDGKVGDDIMIANHVHCTLDWLRACHKRKWDTRPLNPVSQMLDYVIKGIQTNEATYLHYDEDPER